MILAIGCWILLIALCQSKHIIIEVNNKGNDSTDCCTEGACLCGSLYEALLNVEDGTVINITSPLVVLHNVTLMGSGNVLNNITIIGNGVTVACNNSGILSCLHCSNIVIEGITWDQCGDPTNPDAIYAIGFGTAINISITACTFQYSKVCNVVLVYTSSSSGFVQVQDSKFLFNRVTNPSQCSSQELPYASLAIIDLGNVMKESASVFIERTLFHHNGPYYHVRSMDFPRSASLLCAFRSQSAKFHVENSTVSTTTGLGGNFFFYNTFNATIQFTNVNFLNNSNGGSVIRIVSKSQESSNNVQIFSSNYTNNVNGALKILSYSGYSEVTLHQLMVTGNTGNFPEDPIVGNRVIDQGTGILAIFRNVFTSKISISYCNVYNNIGKSSIVYITLIAAYFTRAASITSSNFINNIGSALYVSEYTEVFQDVVDSDFIIEFEGHILFMNNSAVRGAAIYIEQGLQIAIKENSSIEFIGNTASQQGGAIYISLPFGCPHDGIVFTSLHNSSNVLFTNNSAQIAGNSIYFSMPKSCNFIRETFIHKFHYSQMPELIEPYISTSPYRIHLCSTTCHISNNTSSTCHVTNRRNMLGQSIGINATVCDYYDNVSESVQFYVECIDCNNSYRLSNDRILVHNGLFHVTFLAVDSEIDIVDNTIFSLILFSVLSNDNEQLVATVCIELSSCHSGYVFDTNLQRCECYEQRKDIIQCQQDYAEIKQGYWFGIAPGTSLKRTLSLCPIHYCNFNEETNNGYYKLPEMLSDQCSSHRTGVACGECKEGYTLAYDSPDCINKDKCSAGIIILVVVLTILYWIILVALVFVLMYFKISLGYIYGLIYYYSIIDILLSSNLFISDGVFQLVTILSSFAKLTPQFLGKLCFIKGLSGIDQQFIHYLHAIFISVIVIVIVIAARYSYKIASFVSRSIIRVICLLILLSYTSLASTSLRLLRPLHFDDNVNGVYVYSSPSMKYFNGRHIPYGIVALLCECFVGVGLPLLLLLEPFLQRKVNFIKIKPLLDQYQQCYKDKYHWFAAYYLICRQVIIAIVYISNNFNSSLYYLQTASVIIVTFHVWIKPYKSDALNILDGMILLTMVLVINLNSFTFSKSSTVTIVVIMVIFPLLLPCLVFSKKIFSFVKYTWNNKKIDNEQEVSKAFNSVEDEETTNNEATIKN